MTKSIIYKCDRCGREYKTELDAIGCEGSHFEILHVEPSFNPHQPYARCLRVLFADGKEREYYYYED